MRILHTSDWHLGKILYSYSLYNEQENFIKVRLLDIIDKNKPDVIIVAGDIFDRAIAPVESIRLFNDIITDISVKKNIPILIIAGNHDGSERISVGSKLLVKNNVFIAALLEEKTTPVKIKNNNKTYNFWMIPYFDIYTARDVFKDNTINSFNDAYKILIDKIKQRINKNEINIIIAHCFINGAATCDSENPLYIGTSGAVDANIFSQFDYTALGHLHGYQKIKDTIYYSGSPLKYSFDEEKHKKGVLIVDFDDDKLPEIKLIESAAINDMRTIKGNFEEIIENSKNDKNKNDLINIELTDNTVIIEAMARLREYYPNILSLSTNWSDGLFEPEERKLLRSKLKNNLNDENLFEEFLKEICGLDMNKKDLKIFAELMSETKSEMNI